MYLEGITLSEISQTEKNKIHIVSYMLKLKKSPNQIPKNLIDVEIRDIGADLLLPEAAGRGHGRNG